MFRKHTLKHLSTGIAVAATLAVAAAPSALGAHDTWYGNAVSQNANQPYIPFVTDMSGGNSTALQASGYDRRRTSTAAHRRPCPRRFRL